ncbi:uncharacterized protein LOC116254844 [Nymphaea colorata]|nr:uncharacterized protein LOC116254844 [Nymphaea colorata]
MSGGFFRGTSADQDTRFSNKQAKLLKSQKFAAELEHQVDMTKVKVDVIRPWIANRVTELLGFEDEVLINFIFGLLEGKNVDGKQVQIQLTGFMEKNTGKFMKELWSLLLSAQKNISGVPQQFLDAKEEETKKKKAEADRINLEIQKRKEKDNREMEQGHKKELDGETDDSRAAFRASDATSMHLLTNSSLEDSKVGAHKLQGRERIASSPHGLDQSPTHHRKSSHSPRPRSKSFLNNRSPSRSGSSSERSRLESVSRSPRRRRRSRSVDRRSFSPVHSPHGKHSSRYARSPPRRRPHYPRRRSPSPLPVRRRSQTPIERRSSSPLRRKSPSLLKRRSRSPRYRSPSPVRRRFSPARSPPHRRSPSPSRRRLPLLQSPKYRRSPVRSPRRRHVEVSPVRRNRSRSPYRSHSPPYRSRRSLSRERVAHANGSDPRRYRNEEKSHRAYGRRSPDAHAIERSESKRSGGGYERHGPSVRPLSINLRSPQRDVKLPPDSSHKISTLSPSEEPVRSQLDSPVYDRNKNMNQRSDMVQGDSSRMLHKEQRVRQDSPETSTDEDGVPYQKSPSQKPVQQPARMLEEIEYGPGRLGNTVSHNHALVRQSSSRRYARDNSSPEERLDDAHATPNKFDTKDKNDRKMSRSPADDDFGMEYEKEHTKRSTKIVEHADRIGRYESDAEESADSRYRNLGSKKKKREGDERSPRDDDDNSQSDERKQAKRRRKEEKRLRKEERRRRREERHRRREERHAAKMKSKSGVAISVDIRENDRGADQLDSDDAHENSHQSDAEEAESEQKRLEIELRKKALESLRAKKAVVH